MMKKCILFTALLLTTTIAFSQKEAKDVRAGNRLYEDEKFVDAEIEYRKGLDKNSKSFESSFNLGNALFKQGKYPEAAEQFLKASTLAQENKKKIASAYHNIGNSFFEAKEYDKSVDAFKTSLKNNPKDDETRYNLALAQTMLQQQQNSQNDKKEDNKEKQQQQEQQQQEQSQQDNNLSDENAQQILDAFLQDEKDVQERVKENQKKNIKRRNVEKDW